MAGLIDDSRLWKDESRGQSGRGVTTSFINQIHCILSRILLWIQDCLISYSISVITLLNIKSAISNPRLYTTLLRLQIQHNARFHPIPKVSFLPTPSKYLTAFYENVCRIHLRYVHMGEMDYIAFFLSRLYH